MERPPLESLIFFDAAMRHGGFAAAAAELNVSASAVSQRIKSLEQYLDVVLFERLPQSLRPTQAARLYLLEVRPALNRLRMASTRAARHARRPPGRGHRLSVDMVPALATTRMGPMLRHFHRHFPEVELHLSTSPALSDPLRDGFDCCVRYGLGSWPRVAAQHLAEETIFPVGASMLASAQRPIHSLAELAELPLVHDLMPMGWGEWFAALGGPEPPSGGPVFSDSALALRAAADGLGIALGRSHLVEPDLATGRLVRLVKDELQSPFSYWLVRAPGRRDSLIDLFGQWLVEHIFV
jgi:LysR family glycine cleavage system transcriptional activator